MPNYGKLFTLDAETLSILATKDNQSKFVRDAVKRLNDMKDNPVIPTPKPELRVIRIG